MKKLATLLVLCCAQLIGYSQTFVTNTNNAGGGSLREAVDNAIPGELILFDNGIAGQTITLASELTPLVDMTIDGEDKNMTISGGNTSRIFRTNGAFNFDLYNITLSNGGGNPGGAIYCLGGVSLNIENVVFSNNTSPNDGGAIRAETGNHEFKNCAFTGNQAGAWGGAYYQLFGQVNFDNVLFSGNRANRGAGVFLRGTSYFINTTFSGNYATNAAGGGAMHIFNGANVNIGNSIYWNNQGGPGDLSAFYTMDSGSPGTLDIQTSIVQGSGGSGSWILAFGTDAGSNIDADPLFANQLAATAAPTSGGNYRPQLGSPAHDVGSNPLAILPTDLDGHGRIMFGVVDFGPYEFCTTTSIANITVCDTYNSPGGNTYTASGVYFDTLTNTMGCDSVITTNLTVDSTATVDAGLDQTVCANSPAVTLSGTVTNALGGQWLGGGTFAPGNTTLNATYTPSGAEITAGSATLTLSSTGNGSCLVQSDIMIITIDPLPTVNAGPDQTVCEGTMVTLSASGSALSYIWDNAVTNGIPFTPGVGIITYTVTGTDVNGCINTDMAIVTVDPLPTTTLSCSDVDQIICIGDAVTFTGAGAVNYEFFVNGFTVQGPGNVNTYITSGLVNGDVVTVIGETGGCLFTAPQTFTFVVNALPTPTFGAIPDICENAPVYTLIEGAPGGGVYSGVGVGGGTFNPSIALSGTHTLTYTYTDGNGCIDVATQNINVLTPPAIVANGGAVICLGQTTGITAAGGSTYNWDNGVGAGPTHVVSPVATTTYTVTGSDGTCQNTDMITITVTPLPVVTFSAVPSICWDGPPYTLVEGAPGGGTYSGPGVTAGVFDQTSAGLGIHTLYYTYTDGGTTCTNVDSTNVEVYNSPTVTATVNPANTCDGDLITLTGAGALSYTWDNGVTDGVSFTQPIGSVNYTVLGFDLNGCSGTDSILVTVNPLPTVSAGLDQILCEGDQVTVNGAGAVSYTWDNGATNGVPFNQGIGNIVYTVTGTDANGCQDSDFLSVTVNPNPIITYSPDQTFCLGDSIVLTASGADNYDWDSGNGTGTSYGITPTSTVSIPIIGSTVFGCTDAGTITLTLDDPALITVTPDQLICLGFTANLSASGALDYYWNGPGFVNEYAPAISFSVDTNAYYYVTMNTALGCVYTDSVFVAIDTDPACTIAVVSSITPNGDAVNDFWSIQGIEGFPNNTVTIYNRWGDIVFEEAAYDNDVVKWDGTNNGNALGAGTYYYLIEIVNGPSSTGWIQLMK